MSIALPQAGHGIGEAQRPTRSAARVDTLRKVELPEGVEIHVRVAGPVPRGIAWMIDVFILGAVLVGIQTLCGLLTVALGQGAFGIGMILWFVVWTFYDVVFEVWRGGTPGKKAMGLRVVRPSGAPTTWGRSFIRRLLRFADMLPIGYLVGFIVCMANRNFQRLGDLVADTVVAYDEEVYQRRNRPPPLQAPSPPPLMLSREEQYALVEFADRANLWTPERTTELSDHLEPLTGATGRDGYARVLSMAAWLLESK